MIIVSITGPDMRRALRQVAGSAPFAGALEFRLDMIADADIRRLLASTSLPTVVTCRPVWEGGGYRGSEAQRAVILSQAAAAGATYLDLELNASPLARAAMLAAAGRSRVIASLHILTPGSFDVRRMYSRLRATGAGILKFAFTAEDAYEARKAFDFLALAGQDRQRAIAVAMGEAGEMTRVLYKKFGGWATYAAAESGSEAAPGQISGSCLKHVYRADRLTKGTRVYGVVGNPVRQSKGVFIHNELFHRAGKNAVYCRFPVRDLGAFMDRVAPNLSGFSVTIPHKQPVVRYLDAVDRHAGAIGAVNTVIRRGSRLTGSNTDASGAIDAIEKVMRVGKKRVLVLGAGGAARAIVFALKERGARVLVANRTAEKGAALAKELDISHIPMEDIGSTPIDILVNATSVGMFPEADATPVPRAALRGKLVFDAVYNPPMTRLLTEAREMGCAIVQGTEMYLHQSALKSEMFAGKRPPPGVMRKILDHHLAHPSRT